MNLSTTDIVTLSMLLGVALIIGLFIKNKFKIENSKFNFLFTLTPVALMATMFAVGGLTMVAIKGFVLFTLLFVALIHDMRERRVPDIISIMILITGLIGIEVSHLPPLLCAVIAVGLPQLIVAMMMPGMYGGADIKVSSATAFVIGLWNGYAAIIIGLILSIITTVIIRTVKKKSLKTGIPMIPYLALGTFLVFIF